MAGATIALRAAALRRKSDSDVLHRALAGDPVAFSEAYRRYQRPMYAYCLARLMSPDAAADATQEVFVRLLHNGSASVESPRAWLFGIARNVCADVFRKRSGEALEPDLSEMSEGLDGVASGDSAEAVLEKETARNVFLALRRLRPRYRTALILREIHGQSSADIGEAMSMTPGAVDTLVCRARDAFGKTYADVAGFPEACRHAVTLMYRRSGTGVSNSELAALETHIRTCPRCRHEAEKADDHGHLPALLPFLAAAHGTRGTLSAAAKALQMPHGAGLTRLTPLAQWQHLSPVAQRIVIAATAAAVVTAPLAGKVALDRYRDSAATPRQTERLTRSAPRSGADGGPTAERPSPGKTEMRSGHGKLGSTPGVESAVDGRSRVRAGATGPGQEGSDGAMTSGGSGGSGGSSGGSGSGTGGSGGSESSGGSGPGSGGSSGSSGGSSGGSGSGSGSAGSGSGSGSGNSSGSGTSGRQQTH